MATYDRDLGLVTAYGYAKSAGYTGTEEEFAQALAALEVPMPVSKGGTGATSLDDAGILTKGGMQFATAVKYFLTNSGIYGNGSAVAIRFYRENEVVASGRLGVFGTQVSTINNKQVLSRFYALQNSYNSSTGDQNEFYENYRLPVVTANMAVNVNYDILTTKNTVTVGQGGTGMTGKTELTLTRTENSYVNSTAFARLRAYKWGKVLTVHFNLQLTTQMPSNPVGADADGYVTIGTISNYSCASVVYAEIPCQTNGAKVLLVQIGMTGAIRIQSGTYPLPVGFYRHHFTMIEN